MRVHHLNCATMCPRGGFLVSGEGPLWAQRTMVCHCLLIESESGLILVDTALGTADLADSQRRLDWSFRTIVAPRLDPSECALAQVQRLGFSPADVRHIVLTHLDLDHAGGLADFPHAEVHVFEPELEAALARATQIERRRYSPHHWAHGPRWRRYRVEGERWMGFQRARPLDGVKEELFLVPLVGHTRGHCGVAVKDGDGVLFHAGDAYFHHGEVNDPPSCPAGMQLFQWVMQLDGEARLDNQRRLRELKANQRSKVRIFSAHDAREYEAMASTAGAAARSVVAA